MRIAWVHPSWRDLVVDRLADDAAGRREFLAACGLEGALLALSRGGGRAGERVLPLLHEDADWDAFCGGLHVLARDADDPGLVRLLGALAAALEAPVEPERRRELAALARTVLNDVRGRLDAGHRPLALAPLEAWFDAAAQLRPPPHPPEVSPTWIELLPDPDLGDEEEVGRAAEWLGLTELLREHVPDALAALGFPERHAARVVILAEQATARLQAGADGDGAALEAIVDRAHALVPGIPDPPFTPSEWNLNDPTSPWSDPQPDVGAVLAAQAERRLVERVLRDL